MARRKDGSGLGSRCACSHLLYTLQHTLPRHWDIPGSLFNHSANPNVSYTIDPLTDSIRYTTTRIVNSGEELCIFYGHNLWFQTPDNVPQIVSNEGNDAWGGLSTLEIETTVLMEEISRYASGDPDDSIPEDELPFTRLKLTSESTDEEEEQVDAIRTGELLPCSWELSQ